MSPKSTRRDRGHELRPASGNDDPPLHAASPPSMRDRSVPADVARIAPAALEAALAAIPAPAFLVRAPGAIAYANARGEALLEGERDRVHAALRHPPPAGTRAAHRFAIPGLPEWSIAVLHDVPGDARVRLDTIARRWGLTPRQSSVLLLVAEGASNRTIAERLACSEKTVELHVSALLAKTRTVSRAQLVASFWTEPA